MFRCLSSGVLLETSLNTLYNIPWYTENLKNEIQYLVIMSFILSLLDYRWSTLEFRRM